MLPIISKIIERAIHDQLYVYLTNADNLVFALIIPLPPLCNLHDVQDYILKNMDNGYATGVLFLDLKKAFDTVYHDILIKKLSIMVQFFFLTL